MITWNDLRNGIPPDLANILSDDLNEGRIDFDLLEALVNEALMFLTEEQRTNSLATVFVSYYVFARLYERYGYLDQAEYNKKQADAILKRLSNETISSQYRSPTAVSDSKAFTDDILEMW